MIYQRRINDTDTFIYDTVTDGTRFRVRYHKDTPRWSGKWYWLKRTDETGDRVIREFEDEDLAYAAVISDAEHRINEGDIWMSYQLAEPNDEPQVPRDIMLTAAEGDRVNADDNPF